MPSHVRSQATVTLKQIAAGLAERHGQPRSTPKPCRLLVKLTSRHHKKGDEIHLTGLGILQVRARPAWMGWNPATGEAIEIKASKRIALGPAKELKEAIGRSMMEADRSMLLG